MCKEKDICYVKDRNQSERVHHSLFSTVLILVTIGCTPPSPSPSNWWSLSPAYLSSAKRIFFGTGMPSSRRASTSLSKPSWKRKRLGWANGNGSEMQSWMLPLGEEQTKPHQTQRLTRVYKKNDNTKGHSLNWMPCTILRGVIMVRKMYLFFTP